MDWERIVRKEQGWESKKKGEWTEEENKRVEEVFIWKKNVDEKGEGERKEGGKWKPAQGIKKTKEMRDGHE